jgi:predicted transcriptional regulator
MTKCCYCGAHNIDGTDVCEQCMEPLGEPVLTHADSDVERCLLHDKVVLLLPRKPIMVEPETPVRQALQLMVERSIGCVLVVDDGHLTGIFTERDIVTRVGINLESLGEHAVSEVMTANPETIEVDAQIAYALHRMDVGGYRHLPVMASGRVVGVISIRDILQYLARHLEVVEY